MASLFDFSDAERDSAIVVAVVLTDQQQEDGDMERFERRECRAS
jgi:hypothetical protein